MEVIEATVLDRETVERLALMAVCSCDYYELVGNIDCTTDGELWDIIENQGAICRHE